MTVVFGFRMPWRCLLLGACFFLVCVRSDDRAHAQCTNYSNYLHTVASVQLTPGNPTDIAFHGDYAYVVDAVRGAGYASAIHVLDLSNPAQPIVVNSISGLLIVPSSVFVSGDLLYVTSNDWEQIYRPLSIFDISTPTTP